MVVRRKVLGEFYREKGKKKLNSCIIIEGNTPLRIFLCYSLIGKDFINLRWTEIPDFLYPYIVQFLYWAGYLTKRTDSQ